MLCALIHIVHAQWYSMASFLGISLEEDEDGLFIVIIQTTAVCAIAKTTAVSKNLISVA